jgi:hypothetical protein
MSLVHQTAVVAVPDHHPPASKKRVTIADLVDQPLIVPSAVRDPIVTISP